MPSGARSAETWTLIRATEAHSRQSLASGLDATGAVASGQLRVGVADRPALVVVVILHRLAWGRTRQEDGAEAVERDALAGADARAGVEQVVGDGVEDGGAGRHQPGRSVADLELGEVVLKQAVCVHPESAFLRDGVDDDRAQRVDAAA